MNNNKKTSHKILRIIAFFAVGIIIGFGVGFVIGKIIKPALHADMSAADVALTIFLALVFSFYRLSSISLSTRQAT